MKKLMIIGQVVTEIVARVDTLPKAEEEIHPKQITYRPSGAGLIGASVCESLNMPYQICAYMGSGVYGKDFFASYPLVKQLQQVQQIAGCVYALIDDDGNYTSMGVEGSQSLFDLSLLDHQDEKIGMIVCFGTQFQPKFPQKLLSLVQKYQSKVLFVPCGTLGLYDKKILQRILENHVMLYLSESEIATSLEETCLQYHQMSQAKVYVLMNNGHTLCFDQDSYDLYASEFYDVYNTMGIVENHVIALALCLLSMLNDEQAISFAGYYANLIGQQEDIVLKENAYGMVQEKLANMILNKK